MEIVNTDDKLNVLLFPLSAASSLADFDHFLKKHGSGVYEVFTDSHGVILLSESFVKHKGGQPLHEVVPTTYRILVRRHLVSPARPLTLTVKTLTSKSISVHLNTRSTVHDLKCAIQRTQGIPLSQQRFALNGTLFEYGDGLLTHFGVEDGCTVYLILRLRGGGGAVQFADVSADDAKQTVQLSRNAPPWRVVSPGLHIEGVCTSADCKAFGYTTLSRHNTGVFNVAATRPCCPCCGRRVRSVTMGFFDCFYRMRARKAGSMTELHAPWTEVRDAYVRWDQRKAGVVDWDFLQVEVRARERVVDTPPTACIDRAPLPTNCAICFGSIDADKPSKIRMLPCLHAFHNDCVTDWASASHRRGQESTCPICRAEF